MKNEMSAKCSKCSLLLAICFLMFCSVGSSNAQLRSASVNLEGTKWRGAATIYLNWGDIDTRYFDYTFAEKGKVHVQYNSEVTGSRPQTRYNNSTQSYEQTYVNTVVSNSLFAEVGTYKQNGNSVHLDFSDHSLDATINSNGMEGIITLKLSGEKAKWGAAKISNDIQQNKLNSSSESTAVTPNKKDSSKLPTESPNKSALLSMGERLPEQLGQVKRSRLNIIRYVPPKAGDKEKRLTAADVPDYDSETPLTRTGYRGEVEGAFANYEGAFVSLTKFKNSAKAADGLQEFVKKNSAYIVKRETVRSLAGQSVGELVVVQGEKVVAFTHGVYLYELISLNKGEAQKIQKLLRLE